MTFLTRDIAGDQVHDEVLGYVAYWLFQAIKTDKLDLTHVFCDEEGRLPLEDAKRLVVKNLRILEVRNLVILNFEMSEHKLA